VYEELKENKEDLYTHDYKTEKQYKQEFDFLRDVDSKALQSEWRHLKSAYVFKYQKRRSKAIRRESHHDH